MNKKYKSRLLGAIHEEMEAVYSAGAITKKEMREFDDDCLVPNAVVGARASREARMATGDNAAKSPIQSISTPTRRRDAMSAAPM